MKRYATLAAGFALAATLAPAPMKANVPETACSTGALTACAAVRYSVSNAGTILNPKWQVTVWAWNLFGNSGFPTGLSSVITYVGLASSVWSGTFTVASATFNGVAVGWKAATNTPSNLGLALDLGAKTQGGINNGLIGCGQTPVSSQLPTCYNNVNAALKVVFNTSSQFVLGNSSQGYWEVHGQEFNGSNCSLWWNSKGQATDSIATGGCGGTSVTPEPISMSLLATGLAGMGGFGFLRRRRKNGDDQA